MLNFILLPGWGFHSEAMRPLANAIQHHFPSAHVCLMPSLPYRHCSSIQQTAALQAWRDSVLPVRRGMRVCYIGWSLGGTVASVLAALPDAEAIGLVTLGTNVRFVAHETESHAMLPTEFAAFQKAWHRRPQETLMHFARLCLQGETDARANRKQTMALIDTDLPLEHGSLGLKWLAETDLTNIWIKKQYLGLHLFAANDALVPVGTVSDVGRLSAQNNVGVLEGAAHLFPLTHAETVAMHIAALLERPKRGR